MNKVKSNLKVADLFCGAGGFSLGFQQAGYTIIAGIDNDQDALTTYKENFPNTNAIKYDLSEIDDKLIKTLEGIDVLLGGPPCQGFSIAGKRDVYDPRNSLVKSYLKLISILKPKAIVIENVPNILSMANGRFADHIISELKLMEYNVEVMKLNSGDFGVPQIRKRVFFIAWLGNKNINILSAMPKNYQYITTEEAIDDLPLLDDIVGEEGIGYNFVPRTLYQHQMRYGSNKLWNHVAVVHKEQTKKIIALVPDGGNYKNLPLEYHQTRKVNIAWTRMNSKKPCFTIDAGHNHHFHYKANRVPTVRECARIQSFPDNFIFFGKKTNKYRQVGNAVPPLMAEKIGKVLLKFFE